MLSQWCLGKTQALFVDIRFKIYWLPYSLSVRWPRAPELARHPRAVRGPGPARCADPCVPGQEVAAPPPGAPAFPTGPAQSSAAVLVGECGGSRHSDRGGTGRQHLKVRARAAVAQGANGRGGEQGRFPTSQLSTPVPQQKQL